MLDLKPRVDPARLASLLQDYFGARARNLELLSGGLISAAYAYTVRDRDYVLRVSPVSFLSGFEKELFVSGQFGSDRLLIPPVLHVGQFDDVCYAISEKVAGRRLTLLSPSEFAKVIPSLVETLDAIHRVDVRSERGYGPFDEAGVGESATWRGDLLAVRDGGEPGTFYGAWHQLFSDSFVERDVFDIVYERMEALLDYCPEERYLVHGDYGFGNILAENGRVTAVLDWANARYGDFVFNQAWLDFQLPEHNFRELFRQRFARQNRIVPNYSERLLCYECWITLDGMRFCAKIGDEAAYRWTVERMRKLLALHGGVV